MPLADALSLAFPVCYTAETAVPAKTIHAARADHGAAARVWKQGWRRTLSRPGALLLLKVVLEEFEVPRLDRRHMTQIGIMCHLRY